MPSIDLERQEESLFIPINCLESLIAILKRHGFALQQFPNSHVQTIYLMDDEQTLSIDTSFRARRYLPTRFDPITLKNILSEKFFFEIKRYQNQNGHLERIKTPRQETTLKEAVEIANSLNQTFLPLRPYLAIGYERKHWIKGDNLRITIDSAINFWFFPKESTEANRLETPKEHNVLRIEAKFNSSSESEANNFLIELANLGALPIITKKQQALNMIREWHDKRFACLRMQKEIPDSEIEAKISVAGDSNQLFSNLIREEFAPFVFDNSFPFVLTSGSVNHYWNKEKSTETKEQAKALFHVRSFDLVFKDGYKVIDPSLGIIERREKKLKGFMYDDQGLTGLIHRQGIFLDPLKHIGYLFRSRKAIWLSNPNGRIYHVSIDRCHAKNRSPLTQIEIEYTGCVTNPLPPNQARTIIIKDIQHLAAKTLSFLRPQSFITLGDTKFAWLSR